MLPKVPKPQRICRGLCWHADDRLNSRRYITVLVLKYLCFASYKFNSDSLKTSSINGFELVFYLIACTLLTGFELYMNVMLCFMQLMFIM